MLGRVTEKPWRTEGVSLVSLSRHWSSHRVGSTTSQVQALVEMDVEKQKVLLAAGFWDLSSNQDFLHVLPSVTNMLKTEIRTL